MGCALGVAGSATDSRTKARAVAGLGHVAFEAGDNDTAIAKFETALELSPELEDSEPSLADSLGRAYAFTSRFEEAIAIFERRLNAAKQHEDVMESIRFSVLLANTLADRGRFGRAEELLGHALALADQSSDPVLRARLWWTQSRLHALQKDHERAERYAQLALDALEFTEHARYAAAAHQVLAHTKLNQGEAAEALDLLERGFPLVLEGGNGFEQGLFRVEQARALVALGRHDEGEEYALRALDLLGDAGKADASRARAVLAEIYERRGYIDEAIDAYREAADAAPVGARFKFETYSKLAELLKETGRVDEALGVLQDALAFQIDAAKDA